MAAKRKVPPAIKRELVYEAGGKCANPGCSNWRSHIHHLKHWAVYKAHESKDMIAICPSCHDAAHYGRLKISDELLYSWKGITRPETPASAHVFVEPASDLFLQVGTICIQTTNDQLTVLELSKSSHLKLRILDDDILQISLSLIDGNGLELLRVIENNVRVQPRQDVKFEYRAGRARVTVPATDTFVPSWLVKQVRRHTPSFASDGEIVAVDIEVLKPGHVRIQGCWADVDEGIVISEERLSFCNQALREPLSLMTDGGLATFRWIGPINKPMFGKFFPALSSLGYR